MGWLCEGEGDGDLHVNVDVVFLCRRKQCISLLLGSFHCGDERGSCLPLGFLSSRGWHEPTTGVEGRLYTTQSLPCT